MADMGLLAGLAGGLQEGVKSYQTERRYQDEKAKEEADRAAQRKLLAFQYLKEGYEETPFGTTLTADARRRKGLEEQELESKINKNNAAAKYGGIDPLDYDIKQERYDGFLRKRNEDERKAKQEEEAITTPFGRAATPKDAAELRDAAQTKERFDGNIQEMIKLRTDKGGGSIMDREAVARGQQLSRKLLLDYKKLAGLGVLSVTDMDIVESIIPKDPLEFNAAGLIGQDPTMHRLKKFQEDTDKDFQSTLRNKLSSGASADLDKAPPKEETKVVGGVTYKKVPGGWEAVE